MEESKRRHKCREPREGSRGQEFAIWGGLQARPAQANHNYGMRLVIRK